MSYQQTKFKEIADKIREKTGETNIIKPSDFANKIDEVYNAGKNAGGGGGDAPTYEQGFEDGKESESQRTWESRINGLNANGWTYGFAGCGVNDDTFVPHTDIKVGKSGNILGLFAYSGVTNVKDIMERYGVSFDLALSTNAQNLFASAKCTHVPKLNLDNTTKCSSMFDNCTGLVRVDEIYAPKATNWTDTFKNCSNLEYLRITSEIKHNNFNVSACKKLTHDSLMSIIEALANKKNDTSGTQWVCTLGTDNLNKLTDAEKAIATNEKGWVLA